MNTTKIEWVRNPDGTQGYTLNPITGCLGPDGLRCPYCFAHRLANGRLMLRYLANNNHISVLASEDPFYPRFWPDKLKEIPDGRPRGIFLCSMGEWAGPWVPKAWQDAIFAAIDAHPEHTFYLLTKQAQNLALFSPYPDNCRVGISATNAEEAYQRTDYLAGIKAKVKFISFEPLLGEPEGNYGQLVEVMQSVHWVIIGACTGLKVELLRLLDTDLKPQVDNLKLVKWKGNIWTLQPKVKWVEDIARAADEAGIKVFLKDSLYDLLMDIPHDDLYWETMSDLRQEVP